MLCFEDCFGVLSDYLFLQYYDCFWTVLGVLSDYLSLLCYVLRTLLGVLSEYLSLLYYERCCTVLGVLSDYLSLLYYVFGMFWVFFIILCFYNIMALNIPYVRYCVYVSCATYLNYLAF